MLQKSNCGGRLAAYFVPAECVILAYGWKQCHVRNEKCNHIDFSATKRDESSTALIFMLQGSHYATQMVPIFDAGINNTYMVSHFLILLVLTEVSIIYLI